MGAGASKRPASAVQAHPFSFPVVAWAFLREVVAGGRDILTDLRVGRQIMSSSTAYSIYPKVVVDVLQGKYSPNIRRYHSVFACSARSASMRTTDKCILGYSMIYLQPGKFDVFRYFPAKV